MAAAYANTNLSRADVDGMAEPFLLEFGTNWCGICSAAQADITLALADHPSLRHLKVEDGPGRPLGRSFRVKLWPTLILVSGGNEVARVVRPDNAAAVAEMLQAHSGTP